MNLQTLPSSISLASKTRFNTAANPASAPSLANDPQFEGICSGKTLRRGLLGLGLLVGAGAVVTSCTGKHQEHVKQTVAKVTSAIGNSEFLILADGKVANNYGAVIGTTTPDGKAFDGLTNRILGETNTQGIIYSGAFYPTPVGRIEDDGTVRTYLKKEVIGKVGGNFSKQQKGAIALATLLKEN